MGSVEHIFALIVSRFVMIDSYQTLVISMLEVWWVIGRKNSPKFIML